MISRRPSLSRRLFLALGALTASDLLLTGCHHGMRVLQTGTLATPPGVPLNSPLTIDVHCHIFNGTDLHVEQFLGDVTFPTWWGKAAGEILELVSWDNAPTGEEERVELAKLVQLCKTDRGATNVSKKVQEKLGQHRKEGYKRARRAVQEAQQKDAMKPEAHGAMLTQTYRSTQDAKQQIYARFAEPHYEKFRQQLKAAPPLTDNMKREISPPHVPGGMAVQSAAAMASEAAQPFGLEGAANFIVQYFQYRYVSAQDYLNTFTPPAQRNVDLMLASMVDYDWWLAQGAPPPTTLETQVDLMTLVSILSDGRVHGFAPFCPLREVAARAGLRNRLGALANSSLAFVQDAVSNKGCVGVKLYPPMGFAAYGNSALDDPAKGSDFWKGGLLPEWTSAPIRYADGSTKLLGQRLDDALDDLYKWCTDEEVPILAHTEESNGPSLQFKELATAKYWSLALSKHPGLRVDFGHLGGIDDYISAAALPCTAQEFLTMLGSATSPNAYGDAAFSSNIVLDQPAYDARIQAAYQEAAIGKNQLPSHLLYGTDWSLLEQVGNNEAYMQRFVQLFGSLNGTTCGGHSPADCFFGWNAVRYMALYSGKPEKNARSRLDAFYAKHCMPKPTWMQKLDNG
jgi:hypothetical protein